MRYQKPAQVPAESVSKLVTESIFVKVYSETCTIPRDLCALPQLRTNTFATKLAPMCCTANSNILSWAHQYFLTDHWKSQLPQAGHQILAPWQIFTFWEFTAKPYISAAVLSPETLYTEIYFESRLKEITQIDKPLEIKWYCISFMQFSMNKRWTHPVHEAIKFHVQLYHKCPMRTYFPMGECSPGF